MRGRPDLRLTPVGRVALPVRPRDVVGGRDLTPFFGSASRTGVVGFMVLTLWPWRWRGVA